MLRQLVNHPIKKILDFLEPSGSWPNMLLEMKSLNLLKPFFSADLREIWSGIWIGKIKQHPFKKQKQSPKKI